MKRFNLFVLSALLSLSALAYDFSVETEGQFPIVLYYAINPDGKTVTIVEGPDTYKGNGVDIPTTVTYEGKTYTVTTIGARAFQSAAIKSVSIPGSVTTIQEYAFYYSAVGTVTFSKGLKHIGVCAFYGVNNITEIILLEGLETIGKSAFNSAAPVKE